MSTAALLGQHDDATNSTTFLSAAMGIDSTRQRKFVANDRLQFTGSHARQEVIDELPNFGSVEDLAEHAADQ